MQSEEFSELGALKGVENTRKKQELGGLNAVKGGYMGRMS